jgi:catechol 2,3-dioxygenase-like lactoylglutathione lyase family enzyme
MAIGTKKLCHIAIFVKDIRKGVDNWAELLDMEKPKIWKLPPPDKVPSYTNGQGGDYSDCQLAVFELDNVRIELVEPGEHSGPWKEMMDRNGEGLQHLSFIVPDRRKAHETLRKLGAPAPYHIGYWPDSSYSFTDSVKQLGVEINIKSNEDNREKIIELQSNPDLHKVDL